MKRRSIAGEAGRREEIVKPVTFDFLRDLSLGL